MLGIVFTTLVEMLEETVSADFADDVIEEANLENEGAFTAVGYYPFSEMEKILTVLKSKTGLPASELLRNYGEYLFSALAQIHGQVMQGKHSILEVMDSLDNDIHVQVRKLYPDADLPTFSIVSRDTNSIVVEYFSLRDLVSLAEGLIDGAAAHFGNCITRTTQPTNKPHTHRFTIELERA